MKLTLQMPGPAFFHALFRALLFVAIAFSLAMAVMSPTAKLVHHDEFDHINAARYFLTHWLPPAVGDPRSLEAYSLFGMSYLNEWDVVYLLAGKFAVLVNPFVDNPALSLRLFNVSLFLILGCIALRARNVILGYAILLTSAQVWYLFSYFNGDAFPLFLTFVTVAALAGIPDEETPGSARRALGRYVLIGVCIGLLILSKKTFWAFGLFAGGLVAWLEFCRCRRDGKYGPLFRNLVLLGAVIVVTAGPRIAYDLHINGGPTEKLAKIMGAADKLATPAFHPSSTKRLQYDVRGQGVSALEMMFPPYDWAHLTLYTTFGAYNYATVKAQPRFYYLILGIYALFALYMTAAVAARADTRDRVILFGAVATAILVVGLSVHHSWTSDMQPQGRYLFAILGLLAIVLIRNERRLHPAIVNAFIISTFLLSTHSFVRDGLVTAPHFRDIGDMVKEFKRAE